jgi:hypothetical protein
MFDLAVFDLAGTTVMDDPNGVAKCLVDAVVAGGFETSFEHANEYMGIKKIVAIQKLAPTASEAAVEAMHEDFRQRMLTYYRTEPGVGAYAGIEVLFSELQSCGVKIGIDTGFDTETVDTILDRLGWHDKLDARSASDRVPEGRPAPFMIQDLMQQVGCQDPSQVIKIGDTPSDLHEGTNAGCRLVIGVTYGTHTREQLQPHPHTHLVDSVEELHTLLLMMLASSLLDL